MDKTFDLNRERKRLSFILERDGAPEAIVYAKRMIKIYRAAARDRRRLGRRDPFRFPYVEAAVSFRHLLRKL